MHVMSQRSVRALLAVLILVVLATLSSACGGDDSVSEPGASGQATTMAEPEATVDEPPNAEAVIERLQAAGLTIGKVIVYTEETDPNDLLGRPGQYTSKAAFTDTRVDESDLVATPKWDVARGGSVEVFETEEDAQRRSDYIQAILKEAPMLGPEYGYVAGPVLLRLSHHLTPEQAREYEQALTD